MHSIAIVGIHTGIGKTITSAIFVEGYAMDYWKPIQAGNLDETDTMEVKRLVTNSSVHFRPEAYCLKAAMSPHAAANEEGISIDPEKLRLPVESRAILVETAGGLMSPISNELTNLDLVKLLQIPVVLVSKTYLGSINHTMLTYEVLRQHDVNVMGIVFNGVENKSSEDFILQHTHLRRILSIQEETEFDKNKIRHYASMLPANLFSRS